jgi:hypothetical protein
VVFNFNPQTAADYCDNIAAKLDAAGVDTVIDCWTELTLLAELPGTVAGPGPATSIAGPAAAPSP